MRVYKDLENYIYRNNVRLVNCENYSLGLLKLVNTSVVQNTKLKKDFLRSFLSISRIPVKFEVRVENQLEDLQKQGYREVFSKSLKTSSRLVVGFGAEHVLETSLTLHHLFGIPYIPASSLKGVVRMFSFWEIAKDLKDDKKIEKLQAYLYDKKISDEVSEEEKELLKGDLEELGFQHKLLFGTQDFKGLLVFLDAYPEVKEGENIFELDVMNPHYSEYYSNPKNIPGDWENPKPIFFLTVKEGIVFHFSVLVDEFRIKKILSSEGFSDKVKNIVRKWFEDGYQKLDKDVNNWITKALNEFGVGAKTRLGYGVFE